MANQDTDLRKLISRNLAQARRVLKYTQRDVARAIFGNEKDHLKISKMENGSMLPDAELLHRLCLLYAVSSDWVLGFNDAVELDPNIGNAGVLFTKLIEQVDNTVKDLCFELCIKASNQISQIPKPIYLDLLNKVEKILPILAKNTDIEPNKLKELENITKQCRFSLEKQRLLMREQVEILITNDKKPFDAENLLLSLEPPSNEGKFNKALALNAVRKGKQGSS